jgi:hypothetical protein
MPNSPLDHDAIHEDFIAHLQARLGVKDETPAVPTLGNWLSGYQPGPAALARATAFSPPHRNAA